MSQHSRIRPKTLARRRKGAAMHKRQFARYDYSHSTVSGGRASLAYMNYIERVTAQSAQGIRRMAALAERRK